MLDKISKIVSIGTILLILLGVFNLQQRYFWFQIKIFDYVDASEIILSFGDIIMIVFFLLIVVGIWFYFKVGLVIGHLAVADPEAEVTASTLVRSINKKNLGCVMTVFGGLATVGWCALVIAFIYDIGQVARWNALWYDGLFIATMFGSIAAGLTTNAYNGTRQLMMQTCSLFIGLVMMFAIRNYFTSSLKLSGIGKYHVELTFDDGSMRTTTKNLIYIDQARDYIFLRELDTETNVIIPFDDVKNVRMKQLHNGL